MVKSMDQDISNLQESLDDNKIKDVDLDKDNIGGPMAEKKPSVDESNKKTSPVKNLKKLAVKKRIELVKRFTNIVKEKFQPYVSAVIVFGSFARGDFKSSSDIDVLVIVDDTSGRGIAPEMKDGMHKKMQGIGAQLDKKLHIQLHLVTEFWDYIRHGDAIFFNFVREGVPVYDSGFFKPIKKLLLSGSVRPTREAVWKQMDGATSYLQRVDKYMEWSAERLFRAASWSANGALMTLDIPPARPKEISDQIRDNFVKPGLLEEEYVKNYEEIFKIHKDIEHNVAEKMTPQRIDDLLTKTQAFCDKMKTLSESALKKGDRAKQLKTKLRDTAKLFWLYEGGDKRGYAWVFEDTIYSSIYLKQELSEVWVAPVSAKKEIGTFKKTAPSNLFKAIETNTFVPVIGEGLIQIIMNGLDKKHKKGIIRVGVEFPKRAIVDLTPQFVRGGKQ